MSKKILVIDDEPDFVKMVEERLKANQYEVITAKDGDVGLEKATSEKPDLIILDIMMPHIDGYTFVLELKALENIKATPVLVLTAKDKMQDLFKMEGIENYMVKPYDSEELLKKVKELVRE